MIMNQKHHHPDQPLSLSDRVFEELEEKILSGTIKSGEHLIELKLAAEMGVSRTPVREAIRMLEQKGFVQITPNRTAQVVGISMQDLDDIYDMRMRLEGLASNRAALHITEEQVKELTDILDLQEFYHMKNSIEPINELDSQFHAKIFEYSNSRTLQHTLTDLHHMIQRYRNISFHTSGRAKLAIREHLEILEAIAKHDPVLAEELTVKHIAKAKENLFQLPDFASVKK
ncbi:GntR family transcriptional regulator [Dehalobacterium formicoaceticum]|uniref:GntR family transcriptional regulator n=1 Tax=Dehalobacterium formicoaceticum TaxID=51515 RepID=UPI0031F68ECD